MVDIKLIQGDCIERLKELADNSVDSVVTDPPAGISFMGKSWDTDKGGRDEWIKWLTGVMKEVLRVIKPGGHAFVWALPRTSHWTAMAMEDAGFEVRDCVYHVFGQGFPKSMNVATAIDKASKGYPQGGPNPFSPGHGKYKSSEDSSNPTGRGMGAGPGQFMREQAKGEYPDITTPEAKQWDGWGTCLKPAVECWWLCRRPLSEPTVAQNVLKWGTGAINVDGCRVTVSKDDDIFAKNPHTKGGFGHGDASIYGDSDGAPSFNPFKGRFPANFIHDGSDEVVGLFPNSQGSNSVRHNHNNTRNGITHGLMPPVDSFGFGDSGSAARFFYCAKASKSERNLGLEATGTGHVVQMTQHGGAWECLKCGRKYMHTLDNCPKCGAPERNLYTVGSLPVANVHPTVKPLALMSYLIKLITPPSGTVLDPFMGSGSTGVAAKMLGFNFIGIELEPDYFKTAEARIGHASLVPLPDKPAKVAMPKPVPLKQEPKKESTSCQTKLM